MDIDLLSLNNFRLSRFELGLFNQWLTFISRFFFFFHFISFLFLFLFWTREVFTLVSAVGLHGVVYRLFNFS